MGGLFQIVYISTATNPLSREELLHLLKGSHARNHRVGITGLLLYKDSQFMQALEGEEPAVRMLFGKIEKDPRHHRIIPLIQEPIAERNFPGYAMAFRDLNREVKRDVQGYSEFLNTPLNGEALAKDLPKCYRLLLYFKKNIR